jgi:DNA-binding NtrC family response regulator
LDESGRETEPARDTANAGAANLQWRILGLTGDRVQIELGERPLVLGRGRECDVELTASEASRRHAEIVRVGPLYAVRDLDSSNGTFVNGRRVRETALPARSVLRLGNWIGIVVQVRADRSTAFEQQAPGLWGGATLAAALEPVRVAAPSALPLIIEGETGTGKELVAKAIHGWSRRPGPFVAINCAALPESLAEAELFGYRRGAFTGADSASVGHFRAAEGGTVLLDEICELPLPLQSKLLRVLEQKEVVPLGQSRAVPVDVRVVAAAQESLQSAVKQQRFRADLYARLDGLTVNLPPLRARIEDVPELLNHFIRQEITGSNAASTLSPNAIESLSLYDWPFNVRELHLLGRRLAVLHAGQPLLSSSVLPARIRNRDTAANEAAVTSPETGAIAASPERELERFVTALRLHRGNVSKAARDVGISRMRAYRLMNANPSVDLDALRLEDMGAEP